MTINIHGGTNSINTCCCDNGPKIYHEVIEVDESQMSNLATGIQLNSENIGPNQYPANIQIHGYSIPGSTPYSFASTLAVRVGTRLLCSLDADLLTGTTTRVITSASPDQYVGAIGSTSPGDQIMLFSNNGSTPSGGNGKFRLHLSYSIGEVLP